MELPLGEVSSSQKDLLILFGTHTIKMHSLKEALENLAILALEAIERKSRNVTAVLLERGKTFCIKINLQKQ